MARRVAPWTFARGPAEVSDFAMNRPTSGRSAVLWPPKNLSFYFVLKDLHRPGTGKAGAIALFMDTSTQSKPPEPNDTRELLAAVRAGDSNAFRALVAPHTRKLRSVALRYTRNAADAEDVCQDSLLKAFAKLDQFVGTTEDTEDKFRAWLTIIATNSAIDFLRRKQAFRMIPLENINDLAMEPSKERSANWVENPERFYERQERISMIAVAIRSLPVELQKVCLMRNMRELSTKEVARRLGITTIAVRLRLFRAHSQLRKAFRLEPKNASPVSVSHRAEETNGRLYPRKSRPGCGMPLHHLHQNAAVRVSNAAN